MADKEKEQVIKEMETERKSLDAETLETDKASIANEDFQNKMENKRRDLCQDFLDFLSGFPCKIPAPIDFIGAGLYTYSFLLSDWSNPDSPIKRVFREYETIEDFYNKDILIATTEALSDYYDITADDLTEKLKDTLRKYAATWKQSELPLLPVISENSFAVHNDKLFKQLFHGPQKEKDIDGQLTFLYAVEESGKSENGPLPVLVSTQYKGPDVKTSVDLSPDDLMDLEAISSIILNMNYQGLKTPYYITDDEIWRFENGYAGTWKTPNKKERESLAARLDKMRFTEVYLDCTAEIEGRNYSFRDDRLKKGKVKDNLLHATTVECETTKGKVITAREYLMLPILTQYNLEKGNIIFINYDLLNTSSKKTQSDSCTRRFRWYMAQQLYLMAAGKRNSNIILYDTMYKETGTLLPGERYNQERKAKLSYRKKTIGILDAWKEKGIIKGYTETKRGQKITGVKISGLNKDCFPTLKG